MAVTPAVVRWLLDHAAKGDAGIIADALAVYADGQVTGRP